MNLSFTPFPTIRTPRLELRELSHSDVDEIFVLRSHEAVNRYLDRKKAKSKEDASQFISMIQEGIRENRSIFWVISFKDDPALIGTICLWNFSEERNSVEIGYEILPDYEGKGIMSEAMQTVIHFAFEELEVNLIEAVFDPENSRSLRLLEKNNFSKNTNPDEQVENVLLYQLYSPGRQGVEET